MLRESVNVNDLREADDVIPVSEISYVDSNTVYEDGVLKTFARIRCNGDLCLSEGDEVIVEHDYSTHNTGDPFFVPSVFRAKERRFVRNVDLSDNSFCIVEDARFGLNPTGIRCYDKSDSDEKVVVLEFSNGGHFFNHDDVDSVREVFAKPVDGNGTEYSFTVDYVDEYSLEIRNDDQSQPEWVSFMDDLFRDARYVRLWYEKYDAVEVGSIPDPVSYASPSFVKILVSTSDDAHYEYYEKVLGSPSIEWMSFSRRNFRFVEQDFVKIHALNKGVRITLDLSNKFEINTWQDENIDEYFVKEEIENSKKPPLEMEKNVYKPAKAIVNDDGDIVGFRLVDEIRINMHFRKRDGQDWTTEADSFWNGVVTNGNTYSFLSHTSSSVINPDDSYFFSYGGNREEFQSDLLKYLGFSKNDVLYRKMRIRKSFLRLSCYDSNIQGGQSLQAYSTLRFDIENLYSKLLRHGIDDMRYVISKNGTESAGESIVMNGISVDREPCVPYGTDDDEIEDFRLSSRIVVRDRVGGSSSSEGFYLYLWKNIDNGQIPQSLYVKPEFNHAGYGRIIPMMMPYKYDKSVELPFSSRGVKTYAEIMGDWTSGNPGYDIGSYLRYSLINLKYRYCKEIGEYVYYLDPETYGKSVCCDPSDDDGRITINLFEAKIV